MGSWIRPGLVGIAHVLSAAFVSSVLLILLDAWPQTGDDVIGIVAFALWVMYIGAWLLVPLGAVLGVSLPRMVQGRSWGTSAAIGLALGVAVGWLVAVLLQLQIEYVPIFRRSAIVDAQAWWADFWIQTASLGIKLSVFAAIWTAAAAVAMSRATRLGPDQRQILSAVRGRMMAGMNPSVRRGLAGAAHALGIEFHLQREYHDRSTCRGGLENIFDVPIPPEAITRVR